MRNYVRGNTWKVCLFSFCLRNSVGLTREFTWSCTALCLIGKTDFLWLKNIFPEWRRVFFYTHGRFTLHGRIWGGRVSSVPGFRRGPMNQTFLNFMQCFGKFDKIVCWHSPEGWHTLLQGILDLPPLLFIWHLPSCERLKHLVWPSI